MQSVRSRLSLIVPFALVLTGCGVETYHARIVDNSIPFFKYQQELNTNLAPRWRKGEVSLRLPSELKEIPGPKKDEKVVRDPRIPRGLNIEELTGLLGGFQGELEGVDSAGKTVPAPFAAMVLSNRVLLASRDKKAKPDEFSKTLLSRLSEALGDAEMKSTPRHVVGGEGFEPSLAYELTSFEPATGYPPMRYEVYIYSPGRLQVAILFAIPQNLERSAPLQNRIELALQTLRTGGGESSAGASSSGSGPGF